MSTDRMSLVHFGWSAGDIVKATEIIWGIAEAFDNAKGAKAKYATSSAFLRGLVPVLERILQCVESPDQSQLQETILVQAVIILEAYEDFKGYLDKRVGLASSPQGTRGTLRYITQTLVSAFDEMQGKVQSLQTRVVNAMAFIGPTLAFETNAKIEQISQNMCHSSENNQAHFARLLESIQYQTSALEAISFDSKSQLTEPTEGGCRGRGAETVKIQQNVKEVQKSQEKLEESLKLLTQQIDKQHQESMSVSAAEAARWEQLSHDAAKQSKSLDDVKDSTSDTMQKTQKAIDSLGLISRNDRLVAAGDRFRGIKAILDLAGGLFERFQGKASGTANDSPARSLTPSSDPMYRLPNLQTSATVSARLYEADQSDSEVDYKSEITAPLRIKINPHTVRTQLQLISPDQLLPPPSRTGQRPFVASRPSQRPQPYNINPKGLAPPPLPPRSIGGSELRSKSEENTKPRPSPPRKSPSLGLLSPPCSSRALSSSPSLDIQGKNDPVRTSNVHSSPPVPALAISRSSCDRRSSRQSRSSNGTRPSPTTTNPGLADMETDVLDEEYDDDGLLGSPESLPFVDRRKHVEHLISSPRVTFMRKD